MEKRAVIEPGRTPPATAAAPQQKQGEARPAGSKTQTQNLEDHPTKRLSDGVEKRG